MDLEQATILVVDDNEMNRDLLSRRLRRQGYGVATAENGREALKSIEAEQFDLILLDIMMPEMNGFEVLEHLKAHPTWRHIPVIVISAAEDIDNMVKGIKLGAEDYLPKPYNTLLLKARIGACLEKKQLHDAQQAYLTELTTLQKIDRELNATLDVRRAMAITLEWAMRQSHDQAGFLGVMDDGRIRVIAARGYAYELSEGEASWLPLGQIPAALGAINSGQITQLSDMRGAGLLSHAQSQIAIPVLRESAVIAILVLENAVTKTWEPPVEEFLGRLRDHAAMAIANAQMYEAVQAANLAKTEFVSFVSHELKIPMTSIKGYADMLLSPSFGEPNEMQTKFLNTIRANVDRMARLVSDLTDVSRIEAGHLALETTAITIQDIVADVLESTRAQIIEKHQQLVVEVPDNLPQVWGDRMRLVQVLANLISNAYKYTQENGRITVRAQVIQYQNDRHAQPMVQVAVADTGLGIKEEDQPKIFGKFMRADDDEALKSPGTGLGLNITKSLVEMHGGHIWFESKYREGTTFYFALPVAEES
jgi:signal transduction histidine kinase